jgi:hypothetical protein
MLMGHHDDLLVRALMQVSYWKIVDLFNERNIRVEYWGGLFKAREMRNAASRARCGIIYETPRCTVSGGVPDGAA